MFSNMMHGLHYQGYAFSLLLVQWGVLLDLVRAPRKPLSRRAIGGLFVLGLVQGWLSFDYCFLVAFSALPFWLWRWADGDGRDRRDLLICIAIPLTGFLLAHGLHFLQVALYHGGLHEAIADFRDAAAYRRQGNAWIGAAGLWWVCLQYAHILLFNERFFSTLLFAACVAIVFLCVFPTGWLMGGTARIRWRLEWGTTPSRLRAVGAALVVSTAWTAAMPSHAALHFHFIPRHFFLFYLFAVLFILQSVKGEGGREPLVEDSTAP